MTIDRGTAEGQWQTWLQRLPWDGWIDEPGALQIWGYASRPSYRPGDTVELCVSTTADSWGFEVWRDGEHFERRTLRLGADAAGHVAVLDGVSLSNRDSIGDALAVPFLSLYDDGLHPGHLSAAPFDGEGTPTRKLCLIENGQLRSFLHSEATARAFGVQPTGHAGLGAKVSVGPDWFVVQTSEGCSSGADLDHSNCRDAFVLIEDLSALHAGVKATQGSFSLPFDGWLVKDGERISVEAATVAGDIRSLLKSIVHLEQQLEVTHRGVAPHVWVDGLSITGEA